MTKIEGISDNANQIFTLILPDGGNCTLQLLYKPLQIGWFVGVTYQDFTVNVLRVGNSLNILRQFSNIIPFGLACFTNQGQDPLFQQDFLNGNAALCLLSQADLMALEDYVVSKV